MSPKLMPMKSVTLTLRTAAPRGSGVPLQNVRGNCEYSAPDIDGQVDIFITSFASPFYSVLSLPSFLSGEYCSLFGLIEVFQAQNAV